MKTVILARADVAASLRAHIRAHGGEVTAETSDPAGVSRLVAEAAPDLLLLDPELDLHAAILAAQEGRALHGSVVAFLAPRDRATREALLDAQPIGILPRRFDRGDLGSLLAAARAVREDATFLESSKGRRARRTRLRSSTPLELVALISLLLAVLVGYFLPNGLPIFERAGHKAYYIVVGLSLISLACLMSISRPKLAILHGTLIALVTILPTQP